MSLNRKGITGCRHCMIPTRNINFDNPYKQYLSYRFIVLYYIVFVTYAYSYRI